MGERERAKTSCLSFRLNIVCAPLASSLLSLCFSISFTWCPSASSAAAVCIPPYKWLSARCTQYSAHQCWWWWSKRLLLLYHLPVIYTHSLTHSLTAVQQWSTNEESGCTATRYGMCMAPSACSTTHTDTFFCLPVFNFVYTALSLSLSPTLSSQTSHLNQTQTERQRHCSWKQKHTHGACKRLVCCTHTHIDTAWHCTANNIKKKKFPYDTEDTGRRLMTAI